MKKALLSLLFLNLLTLASLGQIDADTTSLEDVSILSTTEIEYAKTNVDSIIIPYSIDLKGKKKKKVKVMPLPVLLVTPETGLAYGAAIQTYFKLGKDTNTYTSQASIGIQYTTRKQLLIWPKWDLFLKGNSIRINGDFKYQKYPNKYWGIGFNTPNSNESDYSYKQVLFNFKWLTEIKNTPVFLGISYKLNTQYDIIPLDTPNYLTDIERPLGYQSFMTNGIGLAAMWDTRDHNIYPYKGVWVQFTGHYFIERQGNLNETAFNFFSMQIDAREYVSFFKELKKPHVFAFQQFLNVNSDEVPFDMLAKVGGDINGRGYWEGRYRDRIMMSMQAEYRLPLFWKFGAAFFAGASEVAPNFDEFDFSNLKWFAGWGIRFAIFEENRVNIRVDVGYGRDGSTGIYFKMNEAF